jgi:crotonobetainyl-CoA:carnitine CoA-transferase CaiB-like acyl-CoA transferase
VDNATAVYAAFGTMVALFERARTGRGQKVGGSLLASALAISSSYLIEQAVTGKDRVAIGNRGGLNGPTDTFRTKDGWIVTQVVGKAIFRRWAALMDEPEWLEDPRFATDNLRGENGAVLSERMARWCAERTSDEALETLAAANIPAGPVLSPQEAIEHPQVAAMAMFQPVDVAGSAAPVPLLKPAVSLGATPGEIRTRPPRAGEHTLEILAEIGFSTDEVEAMMLEGIVS